MKTGIIRYISSSFPVQATLLFTLLAILNYAPVLAGKVPLPVDIVLNFPLFESVRSPQYIKAQHAELGDLITIIYPWRAFAGEAIRQGVVPLWNPHVLLGTPFLADCQSSVFYPLNVFYYIFPTTFGWTLNLLLRVILAGVFASLFARLLGVSKVGSLSTGIIFTFSGFMICWQGWPLADSALWLPAVFLCVEVLRQRLSLSYAAVTGAAFAMPVLAGHPEIALFVILAGTIFALYRLIFTGSYGEKIWNERIWFILLFTGAGLLAIALAAVQILPAAEWLNHTERSLDGLKWGSRPLAELAGFLSRDAKSNPNSVGIAIPEGASYSGILTLLCASVSLLYRKRADVIFFMLLLVCALQVVYGVGPVSWLVQRTPVLEGVPNWRMLLYANFSLAVLAGFGISTIEEHIRSRPGKRLEAGWWVLLSVAVACSAYGIAELYDRVNLAKRSVEWLYHPESSLVLLLVSAAIITPLTIRFLPPKVFASLIPLFLIFDLGSFSYGHIPFFKSDQIYPEPRTYQKLRARDDSLYRVVLLDKTGPANIEIMHGFYSSTGYDFALSKTMKVLSPYIRSVGDTAFLSEKVIESKSRMLDLMNVKYLIATTYNKSASTMLSRPDRYRFLFSDASVKVFENPFALPRAFLVPASGIEVIPNDGALLDRLASPTFDPEKVALLSEMPEGIDTEQTAQGATPQYYVSAIRQGINDINVTTQSNIPAVLVLSDIHYPGWKVFIDGREEELLRVNYAFKGVALGAGAHEVEFVFQPASYRAGLVISSLASALLIAVFGMWYRHRRRYSGKVSEEKQRVPKVEDQESERGPSEEPDRLPLI